MHLCVCRQFFPTNLTCRWSWCSWTLRRVGSTWPTTHSPSTGVPTSTSSWLSTAQTQSLFLNSNSCLNKAHPDLVAINLNILLKVVFLQPACHEYWLLHVSWARRRKQAFWPNEPIWSSSRRRANNLGLKSHSGEKSNNCNQCDYAGRPFEDKFEKTQWRKIKANIVDPICRSFPSACK